jgi:hypothetical protein
MRFTETVSEQVAQAFAALAAEGNAEAVVAVVRAVVAFLRGEAGLEEGLSRVCETHGTKPIAARRYALGLTAAVRGALKNNLSDAELRSDLEELGLSKQRAAAVGAVVAESRPQLVAAAVEQMLSVNQLQDIDWRFGVTASSSEMDRVGSTFLQMKIARQDRPVANVELSLEQFYHFLGEMEKAEATLKQLV